MQFYQITHPDGRLEFGTVGTEATKRAKEVGGKSEPIEVDTTKPGLLAFFNKLAGSAPAAAVDTSTASEAPEPPIAHHSHSGKETHCEKCKFTPRQAEAYVANRKRVLNIDALKQWIEERQGWELATVVEAITYRLGELVQQATGKGK